MADEGSYIAQQSSQIDAHVGRPDMFDGQYEELGERLTGTSFENSMTLDYRSGLHYALGESRGFLRNGLGLIHDQWIHLNALERANLVAHNNMGASEFMSLPRQRVRAIGSGDTADVAVPHVGGESEPGEHDAETNSAAMEIAVYGQSAQEMFDALKNEQNVCLQDGEIRFAAMIQNCFLRTVQVTQDGLSADSVTPLRDYVVQKFLEMAELATQQGLWNSADRFQAVASIYKQ